MICYACYINMNVCRVIGLHANNELICDIVSIDCYNIILNRFHSYYAEFQTVGLHSVFVIFCLPYLH